LSDKYAEDPGAPSLPATIGRSDVAIAGDRDLQFITFRIEDEEYGIDILAVREIIAWTGVTQLPNTREYVRGVMNLRGSILPVFDLRCRFGIGLTAVTPTHVIIIVNVDDKLIGILADAVSQILSIKAKDIRPVPDVHLMVDQAYLSGFATAKDRMAAILDVDRLFDRAVLRESIEGVGASGQHRKASS